MTIADGQIEQQTETDETRNLGSTSTADGPSDGVAQHVAHVRVVELHDRLLAQRPVDDRRRIDHAVLLEPIEHQYDRRRMLAPHLSTQHEPD